MVGPPVDRDPIPFSTTKVFGPTVVFDGGFYDPVPRLIPDGTDTLTLGAP